MATFEFPRTSAAATGVGARAEISVNVSQYLSGALTAVTLRRVTANGCSLETTAPVAYGSIQQLRCTTSTGRVIALIVRIASCRPPILGPRTSWIVECVFAHAGAAAVHEQITALMDDVMPDRRVA